MGTLYISYSVVLLLGYLDITLAKNEGCGIIPWNSDPGYHSCKRYYADGVEIYRDVMPSGETQMLCCSESSPKIANRTKAALSCGMSPCSSTPSRLHCATRTIREKAVHPYDEILREKCTTEDKQAGYTKLCCPKKSLEGQLATVYGAEPNEFPHIAKLKLPGSCGGSIYNKRFIITAAHCVTDADTYLVDPASQMKVIIGANSGDNEDSRYVYNVANVIPHEKYSRLYPNSETMKEDIVNDIALLELDRDIEFGANVQAIRIAEPDFDPREYADHAIIAGWGTTDTGDISAHLQKANFILRDPESCFGVIKKENRMGPYSGDKQWKDQLLCVGGVLEGKWSPTAGRGDSGGPAVCRGPNGQAILCGVTSYGRDDLKCLKNQDQESCSPSIYARVSYFNNWIKKNAGEPANEKDMFKGYVYGEPISTGMYDHQVHITSATGKPCGGTLVSQDVVITAASCVAQDDGSGHAGVQVHYGLNDLEKGKAVQTFDAVGASILSGFKRVGEKIDVKKQGHRIRITDNFYENNLAAIKIGGKAPISPNKLPGLPGQGKMFEEGREIAFPRNMDHGGKLALREFHILDKDECQRRMTRLAKGEETMGGASMKVGGDILCGAEKYSGGSLCDRELGGGLICKGENGKDVLCGVQVFRMCEWSIPNAFLDMSQKTRWVTNAINKL